MVYFDFKQMNKKLKYIRKKLFQNNNITDWNSYHVDEYQNLFKIYFSLLT
jgi:hypothetical protein